METQKKKLLFVNQEQYGYQIDYFQYCKYLKNEFDITYICWDYGWERHNEDVFDIIYVSRFGNIFQRNVRFILAVIQNIKNSSYHFTFIHYFRGCCIIPLMLTRSLLVHLDIRTGSISINSFQRRIYNFVLRCESYFFKSVSIISIGLQNLLGVSTNAYILPLGADTIIIKRQLKFKMSLLYIGTFNNRRIEDTVAGLGLFIKKYPNANVHYTIIGKGWGGESERIKYEINNNGLNNIVELKGYILHKDLRPFFEQSNVGIAYVPITPYYDFQPTTKTFEYLMAGIPVIATGTFENKKIINEQNGFIITDNPTSFSQSLELIYNNIDNFNERHVRESVSEYKWETIVSKLKDYIISHIKDNS